MSEPRDYMYKVELMLALMRETGKSRYTVEKVFDRLALMEKIHPIRDPLDDRRIRIPTEEVDIIREALR